MRQVRKHKPLSVDRSWISSPITHPLGGAECSLELRSIVVPPAKQFMLNSQPKRISGNTWHEAHLRVICRSIRPWTGYVSLIWLETFQGNFRELCRAIKWLRNGDRDYAIYSRAPREASGALVGLRLNCEGANIYPPGHGTAVELEFDDLDRCRVNPMHVFRPQFLRLVNKVRGPSPTIDLNVEMVSYCNLRETV